MKTVFASKSTPYLKTAQKLLIGWQPFIPTVDSDLCWRWKVYSHVQVLQMHERVWKSVHACIPDRSLMSTNVSQCISECERCCCYSSPPWWDDTICHCSDGFRIPQRSMCKRRLWKAVFVFSHSLTLSHTPTHAYNALLELTTKACLSNCGGIRLGYKETHKANVSIPCSSESFCLCNQGKHGIRFEMLSRKWCP